MATRILAAVNEGGGLVARSIQQFFPCEGAIRNVPTAPENETQIRARDDLTLSNLFVRVIVNLLDADSVFHSRIDGADGNQLVTFPSNTSGTQEDTTNEDSLTAAGAQLFNVDIDSGSGAHGDVIETSATSFLLDDTDGNVSILGASDGVEILVRNQTRYGAMSGKAKTSTTEVDTQYRLRVAPTYDELRLFVSLNEIDTDSSFALADDGTATSLSVTITALVSGEFEDTTNSASPASGSLVGYILTVANSAMAVDDIIVALWHVAQDSDGRTTMSGGGDGGSQPSNQSSYLGITGDPGLESTTEDDAKASARTGFRARNAMAYASANSCDDETNIRLRKTGGNSSILLSYAAATSGEVEDTTNDEDYAPTDDVNWLVDTTPSTGGDTITLEILGFELATLPGTQQPFAEAATIHREVVVRAY